MGRNFRRIKNPFKRKRETVKYCNVYHAKTIKVAGKNIGRHWVICTNTTNSDWFKAKVITSNENLGNVIPLQDEDFTGSGAFQPSRTRKKCFLKVDGEVGLVRTNSINGYFGKYIGNKKHIKT